MLGESCKRIDVFSERFQMKLDGNDPAYRSYMGAFCTIIVTVFLMAFSYTKMSTLIERSDVDIM